MTKNDHFQEIYQQKAAQYHQMIEVEDVDSHLLAALQRITDFRGKFVLDLGSGTGRIPLLLQSLDVRMACLDLQRAMLLEQKNQRAKVGGNWGMVQGDMRVLPLADNCADVVIAGWAIGHLCSWFEDSWQDEIARILCEMHRTARCGGVLVILETMTTGSLFPAPPTPELARYYAFLEGEWGFEREVIQTDYQFCDVQDAVARTEFFFGSDLSEKIRQHGWARLPEWTGVWSKRLTN
ncbi:MAG: class I SAM-dependent methyltransferase [Anaerolineae bacterium]|nr:class I SAM-dependent methyltransferase [Anaerolineae bacterium]